VKSISPKATDTNNNFSVVVRVTSPVGKLAIGMSAKINIVTQEKTNVFAVPYDAVTTNDEGKTVVYALKEDAASAPTAGEAGTPPAAMGTEIEVETGMETDYYIEISGKGLEEGILIFADPEGKNVSTGSDNPFVMMGGG
jgi:multidrug efflux pump subunit AcrA (membrane-fusion protein)